MRQSPEPSMEAPACHGKPRARLVIGFIASAIALCVMSNTVVLTENGLDQSADGRVHPVYSLQQFRPSSHGRGLKGELRQLHVQAEEQDEEAAGISEAELDALTDPATVRPFRSPQDMAEAQRCFRSYQGFAYLLHMRKAGGSTLRSYLSDLVRRKRDHVVYVTEGDTYNISCFKDQGELLIVTSLRHPVDRILSAYWYEGRYRLGERSPGITAPKTVVPFRKWLRAAWREEEAQKEDFRVRRVWNCIDNYYVKTLTNRYRDDVHGPVTMADLELAKRVLASVDLLVITEWMGWANQTAYLNHMLGEPLRRPLWAKNRLQHPRYESEVDDESIDLLHRINFYDILLFRFAKRLVAHRLEAFQRQQQEEAASGGSSGSSSQPPDTCLPPVVDPRWRRYGEEPVDKPHPDSFLYSRPFCMLNGFRDELRRELW